MKPLLLAREMVLLEAHFAKELGLPLLLLMENAGQAMAQWMQRRFVDLRKRSIVVLAGPGNNGGDGWAVARRLWQQGCNVQVYFFSDPGLLPPDAQMQYRAALAACVSAVMHSDMDGVSAVLGSLSGEDVIVDALFGIGLQRPLTDGWALLVSAINESSAQVVSVDVPSGLHPDLGLHSSSAQANPSIVRADHTLTLGYSKVGLFNSPGFVYAGQVEVMDIGLARREENGFAPHIFLLDASCMAPLRKRMDPLAHKGIHGHVLVVAGSMGKAGAALLCAMGAMQVGVGLCTLAVPNDVHASIQGKLPDGMTLGYDALHSLLPALPRKSAYVVGPGLSTDPTVREGLLPLLQKTEGPVVLDADALNVLADQDKDAWHALSAQRSLVLTPHPAEAARLLGIDTQHVQEDRMMAAGLLVQKTGGLVVLKGARTIIAHFDSQKNAPVFWVCPTGNPAMATGGMGDVLAGMIGALLARGISAPEAACMAVYWHGFAADEMTKQSAPGVLLAASSLASFLPVAYRTLS